MPGSEPFSESYQTVLDGSGNGSVSFGPTRRGQVWSPPLTIAVSTSTAAKVPVATVYQGTVVLGASFSGSSDSSDFPAVTVYGGQTLRVAWTGGDPGAVATASVTGTVDHW